MPALFHCGMARSLFLLIVLGTGLGAATLQRLSLSEMTDRATAIVRARVGSCSPEFHGPVLYTTCELSIVERWKGTAAAAMRVSVPGGTARGVRQLYFGAPTLNPGDEHIFFLWTGRRGPTQVIGLSQGLMTLERLPDGTTLAVRAPVRDRMLDSAGKPVWDEGVEMPLTQLRQTVAARASK